MKLSVQGQIFNIEDKYISYSPILSKLSTTLIGVDKDDDAIKLDEMVSSVYVFLQYLFFLEGKDFTMDEDVATLFDMMGHENRMDYPLDYWAVKLRDNWIRDNMYKHRLYEDPHYALVEMPIVNRIKIEIPDGFVMAGGAALYMSGATDSYSDIDIFVTNKEKVISWMRGCNETMHLKPTLLQGSAYVFGGPGSKKMQIILRSYSSPTEVIHGFDVDCCSILYDPSRDALFAIQRAKYAIDNNINWFDPSRSSPSYAYRLSKYRCRGFNIQLPLFRKETVLDDRVKMFFKNIKYLYDDHIDEERGKGGKVRNVKELLDELASRAAKFNSLTTDDLKDMMDEIVREKWGPTKQGSQFYRLISHGKYIRSKAMAFLPNDPVSILVLSSLYRFHTCMWSCSDYDPTLCKEVKVGEVHELIPLIQWKEQDPMEQVSSTLYPTPIDDLQEWYNTSPLVNELLSPKPIVLQKGTKAMLVVIEDDTEEVEDQTPEPTPVIQENMNIVTGPLRHPVTPNTQFRPQTFVHALADVSMFDIELE